MTSINNKDEIRGRLQHIYQEVAWVSGIPEQKIRRIFTEVTLEDAIVYFCTTSINDFADNLANRIAERLKEDK